MFSTPSEFMQTIIISLDCSLPIGKKKLFICGIGKSSCGSKTLAISCTCLNMISLLECVFAIAGVFLIFFTNYCKEKIALLDKCIQEHRGNHFSWYIQSNYNIIPIPNDTMAFIGVSLLRNSLEDKRTKNLRYCKVLYSQREFFHG